MYIDPQKNEHHFKNELVFQTPCLRKYVSITKCEYRFGPCGTTTPMEGKKVQELPSMEGPFESDRFHQYNVRK